jgi:mannitol-specific phosphotransferase system IIBC component
MPKKLDIPQENELTPEEIHEIPPPQAKPKRQISDAQREHLNNIRAKALQKKAEMKEETLKAKLAKTIEKKELVKKYDEYEHSHSRAQASEEEVKKEVVKPKKEKKIVYKLADSSSSSSSEEEEVVYVKKIKDKNKKQIHYKKEDENTLDSTLYKSSQEILHKRAIEERVKANLIRWNNAMMPQEY